MYTTAISILLAILPNLYADLDTPLDQRTDSETLGSCTGDRGPVSLSRVLFLENRSLDWNSSSGPVRITLRRQSVHIQLLEAPDGDTYLRNIGSLVAQSEDDADVYLKLALLDNVPAVYWRETFQHRIYRQGMFSVVGHDLIRLCEGEGGETILN